MLFHWLTTSGGVLQALYLQAVSPEHLSNFKKFGLNAGTIQWSAKEVARLHATTEIDADLAAKGWPLFTDYAYPFHSHTLDNARNAKLALFNDMSQMSVRCESCDDGNKQSLLFLREFKLTDPNEGRAIGAATHTARTIVTHWSEIRCNEADVRFVNWSSSGRHMYVMSKPAPEQRRTPKTTPMKMDLL